MEVPMMMRKAPNHVKTAHCADGIKKGPANLTTPVVKPRDGANTDQTAEEKTVYSFTETDPDHHWKEERELYTSRRSAIYKN